MGRTLKKAKPWSTKSFLVYAATEQLRSSDWVPFLVMWIVQYFSEIKRFRCSKWWKEGRTGATVSNVNHISLSECLKPLYQTGHSIYVAKESLLINEDIHLKRGVTLHCTVKLWLNSSRTSASSLWLTHTHTRTHSQHYLDSDAVGETLAVFFFSL